MHRGLVCGKLLSIYIIYTDDSVASISPAEKIRNSGSQTCRNYGRQEQEALGSRITSRSLSLTLGRALMEVH
jgi:hypothetical protein